MRLVFAVSKKTYGKEEIAAEREKLENVPVTTPIPMDPLKFPAGITEKVYIEHKFNLIS